MQRRWVNPNALVPSEPRGRLPDSLVRRIEAVRSALHDVYPMPLSQWLDGFGRDANPEQEIKWWEGLISVYSAATRGPNLTAEQRKRMFEAIFRMAMGVPAGER
jgi:hypothetical protein